MTFKDKIILYLYNKTDTVDNDLNNHRQYVRFHKVDEVDMLESIITKVRADTVREITEDIMQILQMTGH